MSGRAGLVLVGVLLGLLAAGSLAVLVRTGVRRGAAPAEMVPADSAAALADSVAALRERVRALAARPEAGPGLAPEQVAAFARLGLADAEAAIRDAALAQGALIPFPPVLGGTMRVVEARVLNDHWVLTGFEDGHVAGTMLLEYRVTSGGGIAWRRLAAYLD